MKLPIQNAPLPLVDPRADVPEAVRDALEAGRAELPSAAVLARLAAKLPPSGLPGGSGPQPGGGLPAGGARPVSVPVSVAAPSVLPGVVVGALLGVAASAVLALWAPPSGGNAATGSEVAAVATVATGARTEGAPPVSARGSEVSGGLEGKSAQHVSFSPVRPAAGVGTGAAGAANIDAPGPRPAESGGAAGEAAGPAAASSAPTETPPENAESESALLQRAQRALGSSPGAALAITGEHAARYPGGMLAQEREVIAISALVGMGRAGEARSRAAAFLAAHPRSAHRPRIEALVPGVKE